MSTKQHPYHINIYNSQTKRYEKTYVVLNNPPANVLKAVRSIGKKSNSTTVGILSNYFGPKWKSLLLPSYSSNTNQNISIGGEEFGKFVEDDEAKDSDSDSDSNLSDNAVEYVNFSIYMEDNITILRNKIYIITGIPPYRQHLFCDAVSPYKLIVRGGIVFPDIKNFTSETMLLGVPIDRQIELYKDSIKVISLEHVTTIGNSIYQRCIDVADFDLTFSDVIKSSSILNDSYQFNLLYYGSVIKYWPQLSTAAFNLAVTKPEIIQNQFPMLYPSHDELVAGFDIEHEIVGKVYEYINNPPKMYRPTIRPFSAISYAYLQLDNIVPTGIILRNIFDLFELDNNFQVSRIFFKQTGSPAYANIIKKHIAANEDIIKRISEKSIKKPSVIIASSMIMITIQENQLLIEQTWKEDNRIDYKDAIPELKQTATKFINIINKMDIIVFPLGIKLASLDQQQHVIRSNISAFWPKILTTNGFADFKKTLRKYENTLLTIINEGPGSITILFQKGMTDFDNNRLIRYFNKLKEEGIIDIINTYTFMTNSTIQSKWKLYFSGKTIRIYHRTSDIKIEAIEVNENEFEIIKKYFFTILDSFVVEKYKDIIRAPKGSQISSERYLQRLREKDPELYDLRQYDKKANVYSVICQSGRQPLIYDEYDVRKLPQSKTSNLIKYWNFTENKPAYYECPYKDYPYLGFKAYEHPLGYCLPCCQKVKPTTGSRSDMTNKICLTDHKWSEEAEEKISNIEGYKEGISRHTIQYGKVITQGRIGDPHPLINDSLFYNIVPRPYSIALVGVKQFVPATYDAGFIFALTYILDMDITRMILSFEEMIKEIKDTYFTLGQGEAAKFEDAAHLMNELRRTFLENEQITAFTEDVKLIPIVMDLIYLRFDVCCVMFDDNNNNLNLYTTPFINAKLLSSNSSGTAECGCIFKTAVGYYPLAIVNRRMYTKYPNLTRKVFKLKYDEKILPDNIVETIIDIIKTENGKYLSLGTIKDFISASNNKYSIYTKLIGIDDTCYGVILQAGKTTHNHSHTQYYIPILNSPHFIDGIAAHYGARPDINCSRNDLLAVISDLNKYLKTISVNVITPEVDLVNIFGSVIGFIANGSYYYHSVADKKETTSANSVQIPYDTKSIDEKIFQYHGKSQSLKSEIIDIANMEQYSNYLYQLLTMELSTILQNERNNVIRRQIIKTFKSADFTTDHSIENLFTKIKTILVDFPNDFKLISTVISENIDMISQEYIAEQISKQRFARYCSCSMFDNSRNVEFFEKFINNYIFEFDNVIIKQLRESKNIVTDLDKILRERVTWTSISKNVYIDNIYSSCTINNNHCKGNKLIISKEKYYEYLNILAQDITNHLKPSIMFMYGSNVLNELQFIKRPTERIVTFDVKK
jgi:hypothetical protein